MTVRELLSKTDSVELAEWMAFCEIENNRIQGKKDEEEDVVENKIKAAFMQYRDK